MPTYSGIKKEETLKGLVHDDYFSKFGYEPNIDNIDFVITYKQTRNDLFSDGTGASKHYLWAEAKKGAHDIFDMFTQLILTCKKTYEKGEHLAPPWLGCFDEARIAFVPFSDMLPIFIETDFNWNTAPSNHETADFQKARNKVENLIGAKIVIYNFGSDDNEIKEFIKVHFVEGASASIKTPITKDNFVQIFIKWVKEVKPFINISKTEWAEFKQKGVLDCDFYRADLMSDGGNTITIAEKLKIILKNDNYKFQAVFEGRLFASEIGFTDDGTAYKRFWNKYKRPPAEEYQQHITDRRDLLVPENIRERKGSFFTPKIWADKSKEYLQAVFGENWQDEYYVWDCAAGTGNLLAGLKNEYNVWASDIDEGNVETMQSLIDIDENLNLLSAHIFQFDFLNDSFDKLPEELKKIIDDPEKRKKLIIYINPPYAETMSKGEKHKAGLNQTKINTKYKLAMGNSANRELFIQFLTRIYFEIPDCKIAEFSTFKMINAPHFESVRNFFLAELKKCFAIPAYTFDNVDGKFPIGFKIWDTSVKKKFKSVKADVYDKDNTRIGSKKFYCYDNVKFINEWIIATRNRTNEKSIGFIACLGNDFQQNNVVFIMNDKNQMAAPRGSWVTDKNLIEVAIYYSVRHCFDATWLNNRDQFLHPNDGWKTDAEFQNNCLVNVLFNNTIQSQHGTNHWIPFSEKEVGAREKFESAFMSEFLKARGLTTDNTDHSDKKQDKTNASVSSAVNFSSEALAVLDAGRELWKYYHAKTKNNKTVSHNASFYDIREYFQGRNDKGTMNAASTDETYNTLLAALRGAMKALTAKIQPKVYEYEFLKE